MLPEHYALPDTLRHTQAEQLIMQTRRHILSLGINSHKIV